MSKNHMLSVALIALTATMALAGCQTKIVTTPNEQPANTITARGTGSAPAEPDQAEMSFGLTAYRSDAKKALDDAAAAGKKISEAVKRAGIPAEDIQTQNVSVYPQYTGGDKDTPPKVAGYNANISIRVKIRDIDVVGKVIEAATGAGATEISGPTFTLSEDAPAAAEALNEAVADARRRALVIAKAAGKTVGDVLSISEGGVSAPPVFADYGRDAAAAGVGIEPGRIDVTAQVTVVFELK